MCGVINLPDGSEIESPQELQDAFGRPIAPYKHPAAPMDCCLCNTDTERYLTDAGATFEPPDEWADIYVTQMPTN